MDDVMNVYCLKSLVFTSHVRTDREIGKKPLGNANTRCETQPADRHDVRLYGTTLLQ